MVDRDAIRDAIANESARTGLNLSSIGIDRLTDVVLSAVPVESECRHGGELVRKFDGGCCSMLCPDCDRIVGTYRGAVPVEGEYPHQSGDFTVVGPECFTDAEANVIAYKGENYVRQGEGEVKWEYGIRPEDDDVPLSVPPMPTFVAAQLRANNIRGRWVIVRRRKAGEWEVAP